MTVSHPVAGSLLADLDMFSEALLANGGLMSCRDAESKIHGLPGTRRAPNSSSKCTPSCGYLCCDCLAWFLQVVSVHQPPAWNLQLLQLHAIAYLLHLRRCAFPGQNTWKMGPGSQTRRQFPCAAESLIQFVWFLQISRPTIIHKKCIWQDKKVWNMKNKDNEIYYIILYSII